jgi:predicted ATPase/DNA-binding SARP family transcriptional activator
MQFRVLGVLEVLDDDAAPVPLGSPSQRRLLSVLVARRGEVVADDVLVAALWGDAPPTTAAGSLRTYVSRLRSSLGTRLQRRSGGYTLELADDDEVDADRFEQLLDTAADEPPDGSVALLRTAVDLWRGEPFGADGDLDDVRIEVVRLQRRCATARVSLATALLAAGRAGDAAAIAESLVTADPLHDGAWQVLARALVADERRAEALRAVQRAVRALADAGLEPSSGLRASERLALVEGPDEGGPAPPVVSAAGTPDDRVATPRAAPPRRSSTFLGREQELDRLAELFDSGARIVTLLGSGGVGKTRLAAELCGRNEATGHHVPVWVDLEPLADADVAPALLRSMGVSDRASTEDALAVASRSRTLVVLDNAEHVLDGVAATVEALAVPDGSCRVLVTSRERVGVDGEHVHRLAPLPVDGPGSPAARLLADRAAAAGAGALDVGGDPARTLLERLDGLPLAIEMAAAQLGTMTVEELTEAIDVAELHGGSRSAPTRHRSLTALLEWSEQRLTDAERRLLHELSVFAGPVRAADVARVSDVADVPRVLRSLAERSLVSVDVSGTHAMFHLLQTVRVHARRRLAEQGLEATTRAAHAQWCVESVIEADRALRGPEEGAARARLDALRDEARAAHTWAREHRPELAARLSAGLYAHARTGVHVEPLRWAEQLRTVQGGQVASSVLVSVGALDITRGELERASTLAGRVLERDDDGQPFAWELLADVHLFAGRLDDAAESYQQVVAAASATDDDLYLCLGWTGRALALIYDGRPDDARRVLDDLPTRPDRSPTATAWIEYALGEACSESDPAAALWHLERARDLAGSVRSRFLEGTALLSAAALRSRVGDPAAAVQTFRSVLRLWNDVGELNHQLTTLRNLVVLLRRLDRPETAAELLGSTAAASVPSYGDEALRLGEVRAWAEERLGPRRTESLAAVGSRRSTYDAAEWALTQLPEG